MSNSGSNKKDVVATATASPMYQARRQILQDYSLIWIDDNIDETNQETKDILKQLHAIDNNVKTFTERDQCIDFLTDIEDVKVFLMADDAIAQQVTCLIHDIPQLYDIYVFSRKTKPREQCFKKWVQVKDVYTRISDICEILQLTIKQYNQDSIPMSFIGPNELASVENLNQLEPSFMYTQIFKEILLKMTYDENSIKNFIAFCRTDQNNMSNNIDQFEKEYHDQRAIWWYTRPTFIYSELNHALRTLKGDTIVKMGFFIRDLYKQIEQLHQQQINDYHGEPFTIYRGQGLSITDFEKVCKTKGGLISFNSFLSTSRDREICFAFAESSSTRKNMVGILFVMSIDPTVKSSPFADIQDVSYFQAEEEILFSMHTVFRINTIKQLSNNNQLYQVELQLTADDDEQLRLLTKRIEEEVSDDTAWKCLGNLLVMIGQFEKAEELFLALLEQTSDELQRVCYYHGLGWVKDYKGDHKTAVHYYQNLIEIIEKTLSKNHPDLAASYNSIGMVYKNMGEYTKALSFCEKSLEIRRKTLPENHPDLAQSYNNISRVYYNMREYAKALLFFEKALGVLEKSLPVDDSALGASCSNIGGVYMKMGEYAKALSFYEKSLEIHQKALPENHPYFAQSYDNIGGVYNRLGEYAKAVLFYEKALKVLGKSLPPNHHHMALAYNNIGEVYRNMGEYAKALPFYGKALGVLEENLPPNHSHVAICYNNIGLVHRNMGENVKALSFYEKSLEIYQKSLHANHPHLAMSYSNIGMVYNSVREYAKALSFHEEALRICQKALPDNHSLLATFYNNIGLVYGNMGKHSIEISYYERALDILQHILPSNHPHLKTAKQNIDIAKNQI